MNAMREKIRQAIAKHVENFRVNHAADKKMARPIHRIQMDMAHGALDALHEVDPTNPAWKETGWIN